jgi:glutamate/tyrosine decarboxylase-like PLP-dependent enzyme
MDLPATGLPPERVRTALESAAADDADWRSGRSWSLVYDSPDWHSDLVAEAVARFANENALSYSAFPSAGRFESAVVSMVASVVAPHADAYGVFTSGGTESSMLALKAYRDRPGAPGDEVVLPRTAHPGFLKAADYLQLRPVLVDVDTNGAVDPDDIAKAIGPRTAVVVVSAPNFPYGVLDPIADVASIASAYGVGVHVDAALGGLFLPFLETADGQPVRFGLEVAGVTSVSVDMHKYGYGPKGGSVLLFADNDLRHASYFTTIGWPGGAYAAATTLGTRPVGPAAGAYVSMVALGRGGYAELVADVMATTETLKQGILGQGPFRIIGQPAMSVFAVASDELPMPAVARALERRGWRIDAQPDPPSIHFIVFPRHAKAVHDFLADLTAVVRDPAELAGGGPLTSYGVMVRGGDVDNTSLWAYLDDRFDSSWWDGER